MSFWYTFLQCLAIFALLSGISVAPLTAQSTVAVAVTVPSTAGPWSQSLNPAYSYGVGDNDGPFVASAATGIRISPGAKIRITYLSGSVSFAPAGGAPFTDANGAISYPPTNSYNGVNGKMPAYYMAPGRPVYLAQLVGTFANNGVIVDQPFALGNGPETLLVPAGANELLLGINDNLYRDNAGSLTVNLVLTHPSEFQINFTTFIQGNSLPGPPQSRCGSGDPLYFAGDDRRPNPNATSFRTRQLVTVITDQSIDLDGIKDGVAPENLVGVTKAYAPDALPTIDSSDDDFPNLNDCHLLHDIAQAGNSGMRISVNRTGPQSVSIRLQGSVGNPLVRGAGAVASIDWDLTLTIDTSGRWTWTLTGNDDGFPSWELYINDRPIYVRDSPPPYTTQDLRNLLPGYGDLTIRRGGLLPGSP